MRFGARLQAAIEARGRLCVGIDPHPELLRAWGQPPSVAGLERFALGCVEAFAGHAAAVKPQSAFFEAYGSHGIAVLERVLAACAAAGTLTVLDVKRGDIGSTMAAYAQAYLAEGAPLAADAITLSPYLGFEALAPAVELASGTGRAVFVLAHTSNPGGVAVQAAQRGGRSVAQAIVDAAAERNAGAVPCGDVGVVVGAGATRATGPASGTEHGEAGRAGHAVPTLDLSALNGPVLAPGYGAQGATAADLRAQFGAGYVEAGQLGARQLRAGQLGAGQFAAGYGVLPVSARDILARGPEVAALRAAYRRATEDIAAELGAS